MNRSVNCAAVLLVIGISLGAVAAEPLDIGNRWELFVDDFLIERMDGEVELRLHPPTPREVAMVHDKPWEGNTCGYHTIFQDGPLYRMYYRGSDHDMIAGKRRHREVVCYAESRDGIHWERPELGLVEFAGSKANNIIWDGLGSHNFTPFKDMNPHARADAKYKAVARGAGKDHGKLFAFQSADGIRWRLLTDDAVLTEGAFDSQNLAFWDCERREYRCYFRDFREGRRDIKVSTSQDFVRWSKAEWLKFPGVPQEHLYTNQVMPYHRAPHLLIGFPTRYLPKRESLTEGLFMSSRDGLSFRRWPEAFVRPGPAPEKWHNRSNYIWWGLVETGSSLPGAPRELSLYANERYYYEGQGVKTRRYTSRLDGFVSLHGSLKGGCALTKPVVFQGGRLALNLSTSAAGSVRVQIEDSEGRIFPGFSLADCPDLYGDAIERVVSWKGGPDVGRLAGTPVRLRFVLHDADLYAFGFGKR